MVFLQLYLWIAPHVLLGLCLLGLLRNRRYKEFPMFFTYIVFEEALFSCLVVIYFCCYGPWRRSQPIDGYW